MGWWSTCVMGGDTPYDVAGVAGDLLGLDSESFGRMHMPDDWDEQDRKLVREAINRYGAAELICDLEAEFGGHDPEIRGQVVGLLIVSCGAALPKKLRYELIRACREDAWAQEDLERRKAMAELEGVLVAYDGRPTVIGQEGLLEKIMSAGESPSHRQKR